MRGKVRLGVIGLSMVSWGAFTGFFAGTSLGIAMRLSLCMSNIGDNCFKLGEVCDADDSVQSTLSSAATYLKDANLPQLSPAINLLSNLVAQDSCKPAPSIDYQLSHSSLIVGMTIAAALLGCFVIGKKAGELYFPGQKPQRTASSLDEESRLPSPAEEPATAMNQPSLWSKGLDTVNHNFGRYPLMVLMGAIVGGLGWATGYGAGVFTVTSWCNSTLQYCFEMDDQYKPKIYQNPILVMPIVFLALNGALAGVRATYDALQNASKNVESAQPGATGLLAAQ